MYENALYAGLVRFPWLCSEEQWRDLLISPRRVNLA